jgi:hypothetical protein
MECNKDVCMYDVITTTTTLENVPVQSGSATHEAFSVREMYKAYFNSEAGSVSWQAGTKHISTQEQGPSLGKPINLGMFHSLSYSITIN